MALISGKLEFEVEIKSPGSVILETYGSKKAYLTKICSDTVKRIDILEGEWGQVGCLLMIYSSTNGIETISKELLEAVDEKNRSITYNVLEGDLMKLYKKLRTTFQIIPSKKNEGESLRITLEYEKLRDDVCYLEYFKGFAIALAKTIDAYYIQGSIS